MTEAVAARVRRYILDGSDQDLRRLVSISQDSAQMTRDAFGRLGVQEGWSAIDCGCGPLGGLAVLAELVGPTGRAGCGCRYQRGGRSASPGGGRRARPGQRGGRRR